MISVRINCPVDTASPALAAKQRQLDPHLIATRIAVPIARHWKESLAAMPHNVRGYPHTNFWEECARSVNGVAVGGDAVISADHIGLAQRLYGGTITARNVANLTIPICAEAYGTNVSDWGWGNLVLVITPNGFKFLALWLGYDSAQQAYKKNLSHLTKRAETTGAKVGKFRAQVAGDPKKPSIVIFKGKGGGSSSTTMARAERHMNLKFLFLLMPSVEQVGNPLVIPPDIQEFSVQQVREATR